MRWLARSLLPVLAAATGLIAGAASAQQTDTVVTITGPDSVQAGSEITFTIEISPGGRDDPLRTYWQASGGGISGTNPYPAEPGVGSWCCTYVSGQVFSGDIIGPAPPGQNYVDWDLGEEDSTVGLTVRVAEDTGLKYVSAYAIYAGDEDVALRDIELTLHAAEIVKPAGLPDTGGPPGYGGGFPRAALAVAAALAVLAIAGCRVFSRRGV